MNLSLPPELQNLPARLDPLATGLPAQSALRNGAVLLLLYPCNGEPHFVLTQRPESLSRHPGQLALPGGGAETVDHSLLDTALRETREELGVDANMVRALGALDPVAVTVSRYQILPFVGWSEVRPAFQPDPGEVAAVIDVPLRILLDPSAQRRVTWTMRGKRWHVYLYRVDQHEIWGATARILADFIARVSNRPLPDHAPGTVIPAG